MLGHLLEAGDAFDGEFAGARLAEAGSTPDPGNPQDPAMLPAVRELHRLGGRSVIDVKVDEDAGLSSPARRVTRRVVEPCR